MKIAIRPLLLPLALLLCGALNAQMTNRKIEKIITEQAQEVGGLTGAWHMHYKDRAILIFTDEDNNRMRIFAPIISEKEIDAEEMYRMLVANFHSALDAKYSIYEGFVISTFTHPLRELTEAQLLDAMMQVVTLANTFGTTYSSTDLYFGGPPPGKKTEEKPVQGKRS